jgi:hypothetical protein
VLKLNTEYDMMKYGLNTRIRERERERERKIENEIVF